MEKLIKNNAQKFRFAFVGGFNTVIDFGVLFLLKSLGLPVIPANIISTSIAFSFSFFANKKYTFKTSGTDVRREIILFVLVTLTGLWVVQNIVIVLVTTLLTPINLTDDTVLLVSKLFATAASLVWNYLFYSRLVFRDPST